MNSATAPLEEPGHSPRSEWLPGYAWPVHSAWRENLKASRFPRGAIFHSQDTRAPVGLRCEGGNYTIQAIEDSGPDGEAGGPAVAVKVFGFHGEQSPRLLSVKIATLVSLLRSGDMRQFLSAAEPL